jgi:hypothetical protein
MRDQKFTHWQDALQLRGNAGVCGQEWLKIAAAMAF